MQILFIIETTHGGLYYTITYLTAILLVATFTIYIGFAKGYPKIPWLLLIITGGLFFIIGEKVASYSSWQWLKVFQSFNFPPGQKKTILGGILGLFAGLMLAKIWLRFYLPVLDNFSIALPLAMAISRLGCLMAGCCFGTSTSLPWGIKYGYTSMVYRTHILKGIVHFHDKTSAAVHPIQVYEMLGCLIIAFLVWRTRAKWKASESLFLFSVLCYAGLRFLVEFVRDPESSFSLTQVFFGLKIIQWIIMIFIISGIVLLVAREKNTKRGPVIYRPLRISNFRLTILTLFLYSVVLAGRNWFTSTELSLLLIFLVPVGFIFFLRLYQSYTPSGLSWAESVLKKITNQNKIVKTGNHLP